MIRKNNVGPTFLFLFDEVLHSFQDESFDQHQEPHRHERTGVGDGSGWAITPLALSSNN